MKEKLINYFEDLKTSKHANKLFFGAALFCLKNNLITEDEYDELKTYYTYLYENTIKKGDNKDESERSY